MSASSGPASRDAVFTRGSTMRHVAVMSAAGAIGLTAIFAVDLLSLLYVSWLQQVDVTAGVGFATTVFFLSTSVNIGLMIGVTAVVSRALGAGDTAWARRLAASSVVHSAIASAVVTVALMAALPQVLTGLGATGTAHDVAFRFLMISMPSNVLMGLGMAFSGVLRAVGDARRSMYVTLAGGIATAVIDPLLIFGAGLGADGAAWAVVVSRAIFCIVGLHGAVRVHDLVARPTLRDVWRDTRAIYAVGLPAVLTNVATPVSYGFLTAVISPFGPDAIAGNAIITRLTPVAFCIVFALSGAIGPIFGQNLGARLPDRVRRTLLDGLLFSLGCVLAGWLALWLAEDLVVKAFAATGGTADLVRFFCTVLAGSWIFHGALFVANAAFNNLGFPLLATAFNWGKATIGTIPFVLLGARWGGAEGALLGQAAGALIFGVAGVLVAFWKVGALARPGP